MEYRLYEITNIEIEQHDNGQIIKDVDMKYYLNIPEDKIDDKQYIDNIVSNIIGNDSSYYESGLGEKHDFLIVKVDDDFNYLNCIHVFFPYTHFLDCVDWNHTAICEYYFKKTKQMKQ